MSQHSQRNHQGPPRGPIVVGAALSVLSLAGTVYTATGEVTGQEMAGGVLGMVLTAMLIAQTVSRASDRADERARLARAADAVRAERAANTGTWKGDALGQVLAVRYDPATGRFHIDGWLSDTWVIRGERMWTDVGTLVEMLTEIEQNREMVPVADLATDLIRARLALPELPPEPVVEPDGEFDQLEEVLARKRAEIAEVAPDAFTPVGGTEPIEVAYDEWPGRDYVEQGRRRAFETVEGPIEATGAEVVIRPAVFTTGGMMPTTGTGEAAATRPETLSDLRWSAWAARG